MTIKEFIEKAIEGGWQGHGGWTNFGERLSGWWFFDKEEKNIDHGTLLTSQEILLDPKAWQAVGKVEGWKQMNYGFTLRNHIGNREYTNAGAGEWQYKMHEMIDALCEGKDISEFIETL